MDNKRLKIRVFGKEEEERNRCFEGWGQERGS